MALAARAVVSGSGLIVVRVPPDPSTSSIKPNGVASKVVDHLRLSTTRLAIHSQYWFKSFH
jgi:hypothetical protein